MSNSPIRTAAQLPLLARTGQLFRLDPDTGFVYWREARGRAGAGSRAGTPDGQGYRQVRIDGAIVKEHRLVFALANGSWPLQEVDHINGERSDNRPNNLRDVAPAVNKQNRVVPATNAAVPLLGVARCRRRFRANISVGGAQRHVGVYATATEAHEAYLAAKRRLHEGFSR
jgi:hypothetical protein